MKIEIWSDIMCPFCYIGKRKLELALANFKHKDQVDISWHSFLLQPYLKYEEGKDIYDYLQDSKGLQYDQVMELTQHVTEMAREVGLDFNFNKIKVANTFDAHRFTHFAAKKGLQNEAEERLFAAYFVEGKNIDDHQVLIELGNDLGLNAEEVMKMLHSGAYGDAVKKDVKEAQNLNIRGVPYFIFSRKYGLSGAQPVHVFQDILQKAYEEESPIVDITSDNSQSCNDGACEM